MDEQDNFQQELTELEKELLSLEGKLDDIISEVDNQDQLFLQRIKKRKLLIKNRISFLQSIMFPNVIA